MPTSELKILFFCERSDILAQFFSEYGEYLGSSGQNIDTERLRLQLEHGLNTTLKRAINTDFSFTLKLSNETLREYTEKLYDINEVLEMDEIQNPSKARSVSSGYDRPIYRYIVPSCKVSFPVSIVINMGVLDKYAIIFRILFTCHYISYRLEDACVKLARVLRFSAKNTMGDSVYVYQRRNRTSALILGIKMFHFLREHITYMYLHAIQEGWTKMIQVMKRVSSI